MPKMSNSQLLLLYWIKNQKPVSAVVVGAGEKRIRKGTLPPSVSERSVLAAYRDGRLMWVHDSDALFRSVLTPRGERALEEAQSEGFGPIRLYQYGPPRFGEDIALRDVLVLEQSTRFLVLEDTGRYGYHSGSFIDLHAVGRHLFERPDAAVRRFIEACGDGIQRAESRIQLLNGQRDEARELLDSI